MKAEPSPSRWIVRPKPKPQALLRLFCFPYAGGGSWIFHSWPNGLPQSVEMCAVELPGRGKRMDEAPVSSWAALLREATEALRPYLDKPFALFGHSLGATVSFEVARELRRRYDLAPMYLFVSGRPAPRPVKLHERLFHRSIHTLPDTAFLTQVRKLNGTPEELLANPELMKFSLPNLRADFTLSETYAYEPKEAPLECPIAALGGSKDSVRRRDLDAWRHQTARYFSLEMLPGNHFFLQTAQSRLLQIISRELCKVVEVLAFQR